jgi:nucleoside-diphosphate-sugar epimerase
MKILVTGGSGYLGTHIRKYFNADDLSRRSGLDVLDTDDVERVGEYDLVIHCAALQDKRPESAEDVFCTNVDGTLNVLRTIKRDAVFIFASTRDVYGRFADRYDPVPESCETLYSGQLPLEWSKLVAERYVEYYARVNSFRAAIFRLSTIYAAPSPGTSTSFPLAYAEAINTGEPIRLPGGGKPRRDLLHVDDLSQAIEAFRDSAIGFGIYNVGGGVDNVTTLAELVKTLEEIMGLEAVIDADNPMPPPVPLNYVSDIRLIDQEIGWRPKIDIETGLRSILVPAN